MDLKDVRKRIENIDADIVTLFEARMQCAKEVAAIKKEHQTRVLDSSREQFLLEKNKNLLQNPLLKPYYETLFKTLLSVSKAYQAELLGSSRRVGFQGVIGSYSHLAAKQHYKDVSMQAFDEFESVFRAITQNEIDVGILPIENSSTGEILENYDFLMQYDVYIVKACVEKINHCLLACSGSTLDTVKTVYSHEQGLKQCSEFLKSKQYDLHPYFNTAISAKYVSECHDKTLAAIASEEAAHYYNLDILKRSIANHDDNFTKFIHVSQEFSCKSTDNRVLLMFSTAHEVGALSTVLQAITHHGINMTGIKSRPLKKSPWEYMFFVELQGNAAVNTMRALLEDIQKLCCEFKVVGSYEK